MKVVFSPRARRQMRDAGAWWLDHRPTARDAFRLGVRAAVTRLRATPFAGAPFLGGPVRRILIPETGHHLYYFVDETRGLVRVRALWHSARGRGPSLR